MQGDLSLHWVHMSEGMFSHIAAHLTIKHLYKDYLFVCVEVLWPSQPNGVVSSTVNLPNHTFTGQA